jgi:outer membrane lipoprotein SlyB
MNSASAASTMSPSMMATSTKPLWAAVGVLSICVLAMGATLVHVNHGPEPLAQASLPLAQARAQSQAKELLAMNSADGIITEKASDNQADKVVSPAPKSSPQSSVQATAKKPVKAAVPAGTTVATAGNPAPEVSSGYPPVAQAPAPVAKPICASCGTIESVTPVTRQGQGSGVGAVAGGVLGGVVGNQFGKGSGRTAMTVLGAVGGGFAGNAVEKNMKKTTVYSVKVRMEDGSLRTIEQGSAPAVGGKVTVDGNSIRPA